MVIAKQLSPELRSASTFRSETEEITQKLLKCFSCHFRKMSEMEAVIRVSLLVMQAIAGTSATVELQPMLLKYPFFTDFAQGE